MVSLSGCLPAARGDSREPQSLGWGSPNGAAGVLMSKRAVPQMRLALLKSGLRFLEEPVLTAGAGISNPVLGPGGHRPPIVSVPGTGKSMTEYGNSGSTNECLALFKPDHSQIASPGRSRLLQGSEPPRRARLGTHVSGGAADGDCVPSSRR